MTRRHDSDRERSRGQTLVEFALILPVFLLLTLGVVDGARIFTSYISITNAAREGALYASNGTNYRNWCSTDPSPVVACPTGWTVDSKKGNPDSIAYRVQQETSGLTGASIILDPPVCADAAGTTIVCGAGAARVTIKVKYSMALFVPVIGALLGSPVQMSATTSAVIQ